MVSASTDYLQRSKHDSELYHLDESERDFQNKHATANNDEPTTLDDDVPAQYKDVATLSTPGGLASVMK